MKTTRFLNMMAASLVGVAFMSCSSQDDVLTPAGQTYTMSVTAQKGGDETRALNLDGNTLNATWTEGDVVKVYNSASTELGELTAQTAGKSTTLSGTLTKLPENGASLTLKYLSPSYSTQDGTLTGADNSIDKVCDYATATVTATVSGTNVTTGAASFQNQQTIVKFTLVDKADGTTKLTPTAFTMTDGTSTVELTNIPAETYTTNGGDGVLYVAFPASNVSADITLTATVGTDTYTCTASSQSFTNGKYYGVTAQMTKQASAPDGALSGEFTINSNGDKVYFSKGNLQYDGTNWKFADSQWEVLGANGTATGYPMDLFTWGNIDSPAYDGYPYVTGSANLSGDTDWGIRMGSGWRTLSGTAEGEWFYLFNTRMVNGGYGAGYSYTLGQSVNGKLGVVIYPDNYAGDLYTTGANWSTFEAAGCVFLPAAGYRNGGSVSDVGNFGGYWSSTASGEYSAWMVDFDNMGSWNANDAGGRHYGHSVRLVHDVAAPAPAPEEDFVTFTFGTNTVKVAKMNLGATTVAESAATCYGNYYAWAATTTSEIYNAEHAPYYESYSYSYSKYTSPDMGGDGKTKLEAMDDAAAVNMPGWHMPTLEELETLFMACGGDYEEGMTPKGTISSDQAYPTTTGIYWVTGATSPVTIGSDTYKVNGMLFVQQDGDTNNHVFFPAAGAYNGTTLKDAGTNGNYWSSNLYVEQYMNERALSLYFETNESVWPDARNYRPVGFTVRPFKD